MNRKLRNFKEREQRKKEEVRREKLYEDFTFQGFFTVSFYAIFLTILISPGFSILDLFGFEVKLNWQSGFIFYTVGWLISFWIFCLGPKMSKVDNKFLDDWDR